MLNVPHLVLPLIANQPYDVENGFTDGKGRREPEGLPLPPPAHVAAGDAQQPVGSRDTAAAASSWGTHLPI